MAFLTIAGVEVEILEDTAFEEPTENMGRTRRAFAGNLLSTERTPKRAFAAQSLCLTSAAVDTLRERLSTIGSPGIPKAVTVVSDLDGITRGATLSCFVWVGRAQPFQYFGPDGLTLYWIAPLTIREV